MELPGSQKNNRYIFLGVIAVFGIFLFYSLIQFFPAFLGALMFYVLSKPLVQWLTIKKKWGKGQAALLVIVISFFVILLPVTFLVSILVDKISSIATNPQEITNYVKQVDNLLVSKYNIHLISDSTIQSIQQTVTALISAVLNQGLGIFTTIIMMYFFLFFMIKNIHRLEASAVYYLPFSRDKVKMFGDELVEQTYGNALGIPLVAVVQGLAAWVGFIITGLPDSSFWGIVTGFSSVIPIVGTGLVWVPVAVYFYINGMYWHGKFVLIWGAVLLGSLDNVVRFLLAKKMADVHPVVTVLGVVVGLKYFGFTGLIFGPLLISYFLILVKIYYTEYRQPGRKKGGRKLPLAMKPFAKKN